jgi:Domain of unknown function (DUF222)/HNH endonuclease
VAWLAGAFKMAWGVARNMLRTARALERMPETQEALEEGELSTSALRVLMDAREPDPAAFRGAERALVDVARVHSVSDLRRVVAYWRQAVEQDSLLNGEERLRESRRFHASVTFMGMVRVDGDLDPETGETVLTALRAVLDAESHSPDNGDARTPAQRRADALGEVCRQWLDLADRPTVAGEKPHVTVTVGAEALRGEAGEPCEGDHVGPISLEAVRLLACDASIQRVVMAGPSEPLDVGRRTPVDDAHPIRRAVIVRNRRCWFPGCDRPHTWCDAHHIVHWTAGGPTALPNLVLLCRRHHRMVHTRRFRLEIQNGSPLFTRPDGSVLQDRAPP